MRGIKKRPAIIILPSQEIPWYRYTAVFSDVINRKLTSAKIQPYESSAVFSLIFCHTC